MKIWDRLNNGDDIELIHKTQYSPSKKLNLVFDRKIYYNEYGEDLTQLIFQKDKKDLGRKDIPIILHPEDVEIKSVNGMSIQDFNKEVRKRERTENKGEPNKILNTLSLSVPMSEQVTEKKNENEIKCPSCGKTNISKLGIFIQKSGKKQRYRCKDCGRTFFVEYEQPIKPKPENIHCPKCKSDHVRRSGFITKGGEKIQRYQCVNCGFLLSEKHFKK